MATNGLAQAVHQRVELLIVSKDKAEWALGSTTLNQ